MEAESKASPQPAKGGGKRVVVLAAVVVVALAAGGGGVFFGSKLHAEPKPSEDSAEHEDDKDEKEEKGAKGEPIETSSMEALIVDVKGTDGELHHLKVGLALEFGKTVPEEEFKRIAPRGRDAAIAYLRSLSMDDVSNPAKFEEIRKEMLQRIAAAMGKPKVKRILFTDFVAQ